MQEEIERKTINLAISTTKLTSRVIMHAAIKGLKKLKDHKQTPVGKQPLKKLIAQKQGISNIDVAQTDLRGFEKFARKYHVDYAVTKDRSVDPPKYMVFFKARDADSMSAAFQAYSAQIMSRRKKPSVVKQLHEFMKQIHERSDKSIQREKQRELSR